jgi:hypothetical protein
MLIIANLKWGINGGYPPASICQRGDQALTILGEAQMRTIKFLGLAVALAAVAWPVQGQGNLQPGAFPGIDRLARIEAARVARQHTLRQHAFRPMAARRGARLHAMQWGVRGYGGRQQAMVGAGIRAGARAGFRAGLRAERLANATPEQKAFVEQFRAQRQAVHAQVQEGKLTREQARAQMRQWATEHRPKK